MIGGALLAVFAAGAVASGYSELIQLA